MQQFGGELAPAVPTEETGMTTESTRAAAEVQAAMVIAKKFPRDIVKACDRINQNCRRPRFAEKALYTYPRGGTQIEGPSIRMAEMMAQSWGNMVFGITELAQYNGESIVQAYAWDLETNTRQAKTFTVKHERHTRSGVTILTDPRDIYETVANNGARRLRACILGVIPTDVQDDAVDQCRDTMLNGSDEPLIDRIKKMATAFAKLGVTQEMIEGNLGHKIEVTSPTELVKMQGIYKSITDGMSPREQWFDVVPEGDSVTDLKPGKKKATRKKAAKKPEPPTDEPSMTDPATDTDWDKIEQVCMLKLNDAGFDGKGDVKKMAAFACIGSDIDVSELSLLHGQVAEVSSKVLGMTDDDVFTSQE